MVDIYSLWHRIQHFHPHYMNTVQLKMCRVLNQWHRFLTYDGIKEPEYSTVLEICTEDSGPALISTYKCYRYSFDDNGILRKKEEPKTNGHYGEDSFPVYHCLKKIWLYDENGKIIRYCDACELKDCKKSDEYVISMVRSRIVDGKYIDERYGFTVEDLLSDELPRPVVTWSSKDFGVCHTIDSWLYPNASSSKHSLRELRDEALKPVSVYNILPVRNILRFPDDSANSIIWRASPKFADRLWLKDIVNDDAIFQQYDDEISGAWAGFSETLDTRDDGTIILTGVRNTTGFLYLSGEDGLDPISIIGGNICDDDTAEVLERLYLDDNFLIIEKDAFSRCQYLEKIYVPATVKKIAENVFRDCPNLTVYVQKGSFVEEYCVKNNLPHVAKGEKVDPRPFFHLD